MLYVELEYLCANVSLVKDQSLSVLSNFCHTMMVGPILCLTDRVMVSRSSC